MGNDFGTLPEGLIEPVNDAAADHLRGFRLPSIKLQSTNGALISLAELSGRAVIYIYPMTGVPGKKLPDGWDEIPGARGCTPQSCSFRDHYQEIKQAGVSSLFGLSTQDTPYQQEAAERLHLPFSLLSDERLELGSMLRLPTFAADGKTLYKRLTLVIDQGVITHLFYPVFPPDQSAVVTLAWLRDNPALSTQATGRLSKNS
jgi:peroxiredoxin